MYSDDSDVVEKEPRTQQPEVVALVLPHLADRQNTAPHIVATSILEAVSSDGSDHDDGSAHDARDASGNAYVDELPESLLSVEAKSPVPSDTKAVSAERLTFAAPETTHIRSAALDADLARVIAAHGTPATIEHTQEGQVHAGWSNAVSVVLRYPDKVLTMTGDWTRRFPRYDAVVRVERISADRSVRAPLSGPAGMPDRLPPVVGPDATRQAQAVVLGWQARRRLY